MIQVHQIRIQDRKILKTETYVNLDNISSRGVFKNLNEKNLNLNKK
jgi:hypothetical protein